MNCKTQILMYLVLLLNTVHGIKMTQKEVEGIMFENKNIKNNSTNISCPEYAYQLDDTYLCHYTFYCIDKNNCQSADPSSSTVQFFENDGSTHEYLKNKSQCSQDSECLSNKCSNGICVADGKSKFTQCIDRYEVVDERPYIFCGKLEGEKCNKNDDCAGKCNNGICSSSNEINRISEQAKKGFSILIILIIALPVICVVSCCFALCWCIRNRDRKEKEMKLKNIKPQV